MKVVKASISFAHNSGRILLCLTLCGSALGGCAREKDRLDEEARNLCSKDGGTKIYEEVKLPARMFDEFGVVIFPDATPQRPLGSHYIIEESAEYYRKGNPSLRKEHARIIRSSDSKVLGEFSSYHRVGGDFPGPWHESTFVCPPNTGTAILKKSVFQIETKAGRP